MVLDFDHLSSVETTDARSPRVTQPQEDPNIESLYEEGSLSEEQTAHGLMDKG